MGGGSRSPIPMGGTLWGGSQSLPPPPDPPVLPPQGCGPTMARAVVVNAAQLASYSQSKQFLLDSGEGGSQNWGSGGGLGVLGGDWGVLVPKLGVWGGIWGS